jgi:hypothetical protein
MGVLDDAIREHLDLKRRHGVAEEELQRQEEEALGPARRDVAQQLEDADEPAVAAAEDETALFDLDAPSAESAAPDEAAAEEAALQHEEPVGEPGHEPDPHDALGETQPHGFEAIADEDEEAEPYNRDPDEEDVVAAEDEDEGEDEDDEEEDQDVLEDTPDFLQETPEHDRLWFEQKPPRDFDFD